jgi:RNase P/RNase MRP subunit POP5
MRFKRRYFIVELIFENDQPVNRQELKMKSIQDVIHKNMEKFYGDLGMAQMMPSFSIVYFNSNTNLLIMRIARELEKKFHTLLTFTKMIGDINVYFHILHKSGSIKKCKKFLVEYCYKDYVNSMNQTSTAITSEVVKEIIEKIS